MHTVKWYYQVNVMTGENAYNVKLDLKTGSKSVFMHTIWFGLCF